MALHALRIAALTVTAGFVMALPCIALPAPASALTAASIEPSFAPDLPGARTSITFAARFSGGAGALPAPLHKAVILLPAGLAETLEWPMTRGCSRAHLQTRGARGCPPRSQIGAGSALIEWRERARTARERANLRFFIGPTNGEYTLELLAEGRRPLRRRVVITEALFAVSMPYSAGMEAIIPPIPTRPGQPDASIASFSVTMGPSGHAAHPRGRPAADSPWGNMGFFVPRSCPAGGFPWAADFTYAGGASQEATATVPCP